MTRRDVHRAVGGLEDDAVRGRVAEGDFSDLRGLSLSDPERTTVRAIADKPPFGYAGHRFLRRWTASAAGPGDRFSAVTAIADEGALAAFDRLHDALAGNDDPHHVARRAFVRGEEVDGDALGELLGGEALDGLVRTGALQRTGGDGAGVRARVGVLVAGPLMVVVPPQVEDQGDLTYFGGDSIGLLERAWPLALGGRLAIELGTGTGFLAAALAPRYELVIATELLRSSASVAAITFRLNGTRPGSPRGRLAVCIADVARGLRPGCADFVIANPPFMPTAHDDSSGPALTYADGGPTGLELPTRFIVEGAILLAPGATAITRCLDISFDDGRRPLADLCVALRAQGLRARIEPIGASDAPVMVDARRAGGLPGTGMLSDVIVER